MFLSSHVKFLIFYIDFFLLECSMDVTALGEDTWDFQRAEKVDLLQLFSHFPATNNISMTQDGLGCPNFQIGPYGALMMSTWQAFGQRFSDEFSLLMELQSSQSEDSSVLTMINSRHHIHLQLRLSSSSLTFISTQQREYEITVGSLRDGQWHHLALSVSPFWLEVYVDCSLVERLNWAYPWQLISTDGMLMVGGSIERSDTPFHGALRQLTFVMGDPDAARDQCNRPACDLSSSKAFWGWAGFHACADGKLCGVSVMKTSLGEDDDDDAGEGLALQCSSI